MRTGTAPRAMAALRNLAIGALRLTDCDNIAASRPKHLQTADHPRHHAIHLSSSALDSHVVGWARYDGTGRTSPTTGDSDEPPYETGVAAFRDGWRLFQAAHLIPPHPGHDCDVSFLKHEFFFERIVDASAP